MLGHAFRGPIRLRIFLLDHEYTNNTNIENPVAQEAIRLATFVSIGVLVI